MSPLYRDVSKTELAILQALWSRGGGTIRDLTADLYPTGRSAHYATVQRLLDRLQEKGFVTRDRSTRAHEFRASVPRSDFLGARLRELADRLCAGSNAPLLTQLVDSRSLSREERAELRALLDAADHEEQDS